jgi:AraC-like DNA-binding protein
LIKLIALLLPLFANLYAAILLFFTSSKKYQNRFYLGLFFLNSFILFLGHFFSFFEYWKAFKYYDGIFLTSLLAFYPLYYLYIRKAFNFQLLKTKWLYHFLPAIGIGVIMTITAMSASWNEYQEYMNCNVYGTETTSIQGTFLVWLYKGTRYFHLIQIIFYNFIVIEFLLKTKSSMRNLFSNLDRFQIRYFYIVTISFIVFMSIPGFVVTLVGRTPLNENVYQLLVACILFTFLFLILAIVGIQQVPISGTNIESEHDTNASEICINELELVEASLISYFKTSKPWLNSHLNIWEVSKSIGSNRSYVSRVINENIGCNFNDFVNMYRVNEAKKLLIEQPETTILEISEKAGFGSVNSFMRIFKKMENCTPNQFRKKGTNFTI